MTEPADDYAAQNAERNGRFRGHDARDWTEWAAFATDVAAQVPLDADRAWLNRVKASHRGIGERRGLRHLIAGSADQAYLDEICQLTALERLELEWPVTARSLDGLRALKHLRHLSIDTPRNIIDFTPLLDLPALETLLITNAKHMADISWLSDAHHLSVIGVEGSTWTDQKIPSLKPLAGLRNLRALLAVSVRLGDQDLSPLAECPRLEYLGCARIAPHDEFERLHAAKPDLICTWFQPSQWR